MRVIYIIRRPAIQYDKRNFFTGWGLFCVFKFQNLPPPCTLYPFDTLHPLHITLLLYHCDTLSFAPSLYVGKVTPPTNKVDKVFVKRGSLCLELSAPQYTPPKTPPQFPQNRVYFLAYYRTKENPVFIYFYCTLFRIHCILIFSSTHFAISSTIICVAFVLYITFGT